jgi:hypothetical protein
MSGKGHSTRTIARVLKLSRCPVRKYLEPVAEQASGGSGWMEAVDWESVGQEVNGKGITIKQIEWLEASDPRHLSAWGAWLRNSPAIMMANFIG